MKKHLPPHIALRLDELRSERKKSPYRVSEILLEKNDKSGRQVEIIQSIISDHGNGPILTIDKTSINGSNNMHLQINLTEDAITQFSAFFRTAEKFNSFTPSNGIVFDSSYKLPEVQENISDQKVFSISDMISFLEASKKEDKGFDYSIEKLKSLKEEYNKPLPKKEIATKKKLVSAELIADSFYIHGANAFKKNVPKAPSPKKPNHIIEDDNDIPDMPNMPENDIWEGAENAPQKKYVYKDNPMMWAAPVIQFDPPIQLPPPPLQPILEDEALPHGDFDLLVGENKIN